MSKPPTPSHGHTPLPTPLPASAPAASAQDILSQAAAGLTFPSETDAPFVPFAWPQAAAEATAEVVAREARLPAGSHLEQQSLEEFFAPAVAEEDWMNPAERATAKNLAALLQTIRAALPDATVFRVGEGSVDVFIVGRAGVGLAGLQTKVVET